MNIPILSPLVDLTVKAAGAVVHLGADTVGFVAKAAVTVAATSTDVVIGAVNVVTSVVR